MIMPCMNSTSACDRGGSVALVDGGSVLLGLPGAPGCTTTGFAGSVCRALIAEEKTPAGHKKPVETLAASNIPRSILRRCHSICVDFGICANPTLGFRCNVEPRRRE